MIHMGVNYMKAQRNYAFAMIIQIKKSQFVTFFFHPLLFHSLALLLPQSCQFTLSVNTGNNNRLEQVEHDSFIFWVTTRIFYIVNTCMCSFFECYIYTYVLVKVVALFLCCKKNYFSVPSCCNICQCELEQGYNKHFKIKKWSLCDSLLWMLKE